MRTAFVPMTIFIVLVIMIVAAYHREVVRYKQTSGIICRTLTNPTIPLIEETKDAWKRTLSMKGKDVAVMRQRRIGVMLIGLRSGFADFSDGHRVLTA